MVRRLLKISHQLINAKNRRRLINTSPTLICSNCAGGFIYHWLHLQFRSPFINLYLTPEDFVLALEHLDEFLKTPIEEFHGGNQPYPVGIGAYGIKVYFMHYETFEEAVNKWNVRRKRVDRDNMGIMLTNYKRNDIELLKRFDALPYQHKVVFVPYPVPEIESAFYLKGYDAEKKNLYRTVTITGKRCIDQFDYVRFINQLED